MLAGNIRKTLSVQYLREVKEITLHPFRHTHTSLLIEAEVGLKEIQQRLGHTEIHTTMNIYAHMTDNKASHSKLWEASNFKDIHMLGEHSLNPR